MSTNHGDSEKPIKIRSVKFNVIMNMILTASQFIFPLITVPYVSRVLAPSGTGAVAFSQSVVSYFSLVAMLGISTYGVQACASVRDDRKRLSQTVQELLVILLCSTVIVYAVYILALFTVQQFSADKPLFLISSISLVLGSIGVEWFYQAIEQYEYITVRNIVFKVIGLVLMFWLVRTQQDYRLYALVTVAANGGSNILNVFRLRKFVDFSRKKKLRIRRHFKPILSFFVMTAGQGMATQADLVLLGFMGSSSMVGLYQLVTKIKSLAYAVVNSVSNVMLPRLSYYHGTKDSKKYISLIAKNFDFLTMMSLAATELCIILANPIVRILGGAGFSGSVLPLRIVAVSLVFSAYNTLLAQHLIASHKEKIFARVCVAMLIAIIVYCVIFIPILGVLGAALSMVLCEMTELIILVAYSRKVVRDLIRHSELLRIFFAACIASGFGAVATWYCAELGVLSQLFVPLCVFGVAYFLLLLLMRERFVSALAKRIRRGEGR
jgi:O-antigen/teichoic acid export membrane protein